MSGKKLSSNLFEGELTRFRDSDTEKGYFFDAFPTETHWNLSATETGIPNSASWKGQIFMTATVTVGEMSYTNRTNSYNIFYTNSLF